MLNRIDPYTPDEPMYECLDCGGRSSGGTHGPCSDCGGTVKNIAVPRE
ncbi:MAG: rubrerythrin-like domain-containing protein [Halobacteriales archaeon]|nr:rubrerythrin-like domain-containing protein [Halobacteriales archaeon]